MQDPSNLRCIDPVTLGTADVPSDDELSRALGHAFLAYVCNTSEDEIKGRLSGASRLQSQQEAVLQETLRVAKLLAAQRRPININNRPGVESLSDTFARFGDFVPDAETSIANLLRAAAGGDLPELASEDPVKAALGQIARDWYPVLLIPPSDEGFGPTSFRFRLGAFSWQHPGLRAFVDALNSAEEPFRELFGDGDLDPVTASRPFMSSSGRGGAIQVGVLASTLTSNAETRAYLEADITPARYLSEIERQVDELRLLAAGDSVAVPAAVGLATATVIDDFRLETPWGVVIPASQWHREQAPIGADLVLLTDFQLQLDLDVNVEPGTYQGPPRGFLEAYAAFERRIDLVRLAFTLALDRDPPVALTSTWRLIADPTTMTGFAWGPASSPTTVAELRAGDVEDLRQWASVIDQHFHPSLGLAVRRTLGAISLRLDPADALVDAVIALENLFGTGQSEVGFRLSAALAWFLESDAESRVERQKAVTKLYNLRSKIVHGSEVDAAKLDPDRVAASKLAVESLRKLFRDRPDLIAAGDQRGKLVILRGSD